MLPRTYAMVVNNLDPFLAPVLLGFVILLQMCSLTSNPKLIRDVNPHILLKFT